RSNLWRLVAGLSYQDIPAAFILNMIALDKALLYTSNFKATSLLINKPTYQVSRWLYRIAF
ncbi:hypothetical protein, partial [Xylella fastidiosa]|uniref:hypothetical protein n=1 Tax=Xylella fastidiosa TaxID=2371 RepID=UPI002362B7F6